MSAEKRLKRLGYASLLGALLSLAPDSPFINDLVNFQPRKSYGRELDVPEFQALVFTDQMRETVRALQSGDINALSSHLTSTPSWGTYGTSNGETSGRQEVLNLFATSFKNNKPQCVGFFNAGRAQVGYIMRGLRAKNPNAPASMVIAGGEFTKAEISQIKELSQKDLDALNRGLTPCTVDTAPAKPTPVPTAAPTPTPPSPIEALSSDSIPEELKGRSIAYVSTDGNQENVFTAKIDGSNKTQLTNDNRTKRDLRTANGGGIIYSSLGIKGDITTKSQVVYLNSKTNKENILWSGVPDEGIPFCPSEHKGTIYWSLHEQYGTANRSENIWSAKQDGSNRARVTSDNEGSSEHCPVISGDGRVMFNDNFPGTHGSRPSGLVVMPNIEALGRDFDPNKISPLTDGYTPIGWINSSEIVFTRNETRAPALYRIKTDGTGEKKIMDNVYSAALSKDGKWLIVTAGKPVDAGSPDIKPYLVSVDGGKPIKLPDSLGRITYVDWMSDVPEIKRNIVLVLQGMDSSVVDRQTPDGLTQDLFSELPNFGYDRDRDFGLLSVTGGNIINDLWVPNKQTCNDTYRDPESLGLSVAVDLKKILDFDPSLQVTVVGHSYGGVILANAMEVLQKELVDTSRLRLITADSPIQGVSKPFFDYLGAIFQKQMDKSCFLTIAPNPNYLNTPAGQSLLSMWDNRAETNKRWRLASEGFRAKGGQITSMGNIQDCVMDVFVCTVGLEYELKVLWNLLWRRTVVVTQEMEGSEIVWRSLGIAGFGHDRFFKDFENDGLSTLISVIGPQIRGNS